MEKAIVIGCPGSGKSTFARRLSKATGLPLFYLDMLYHKPDKTTYSKEAFDAYGKKPQRWELAKRDEPS